jgi:hypothetical protein
VDEADEVLLEDGVATLRVLLTDAPAEFIGSAEVDIGEITLISADGERTVLSEDGTTGFVNLLDFRGSATTPIAEAEIEGGDYTELRMVVEAARVGLMPGRQFRDGSTEMALKVPSGAQSGIKLKLRGTDDGPLEIIPGETVLVLDFDVHRSFVLRGNPDTPAGVHGVIFTPTIRVTGEDVAATISGTVTTELDASVEGLVVTAAPTDGGTVEGYQTEAGTALTDADGNYTIFFLVPGSYDVTVEVDEGLGTDPEVYSVLLEYKENETGVDFEVIDITGSIAGTVTADAALGDVPVDGLTVTATPADPELDPLEAMTDENGDYLFEDLLAGTWVVTVAVPGDDQVTDPESITVELENGQDVVDQDFLIVEDVSGSVSGTVTLGAGVDPASVSVLGLTVTATPDDPENAVEVMTDENGDYLFPRLAPGDWTITVEVGEGLTTDPTEEVVDVVDDEADEDIDFEIVPAS